MSDRRDDTSIAPRRSLSGPPGASGTSGASAADGSSGGDRPVLPPMPKEAGRNRKPKPAREKRARGRVREVSSSTSSSSPGGASAGNPSGGSSGTSDTTALPRTPASAPPTRPTSVGPASVGPTKAAPARGRGPRTARLRITQVDPWSVTKTAFLLSIALGVVTVVAVAIVWTVLGAAGLWDSINSTVQETVGDSSGSPFQIQEYVGTSRVLGFSLIVAVVDVILITMIATLGAFLYNLTATLLGGVEVTLAEDD